MQYTKKWLILLVIIAINTACTNPLDHATNPKETAPLTQQASLNTHAAEQIQPVTRSNITPPMQNKPTEDTAACFMLENCQHKQTTESAPETANASGTTTSAPTQDGNNSNNPFGNTQYNTQVINSPNQNVILTQLPTNNTIQCFNCIDTAKIKTPTAELKQAVTLKDVEFNQLSSNDSINSVNGVITNNKALSGTLEQSFNFKSIEMIQHNSVGSIHAINYMGDPIPKR